MVTVTPATVAPVALLAVLVGARAFFTWLTGLNVRHAEDRVAAEREFVEGELGVDADRLLRYHRLTSGLSALRSWVWLVLVVLVVYSGLFGDAVRAVESLGLGPVASGVVFLTGAGLAATVVGWPFEFVSTFVVEQNFGFNESTVGLWVRDRLKGLAVGAVLGAVVAAGLVWTVETFALWPVAALVLFVVFQLVVLVVYPRVIAPLFNDFEPVEGELRRAVEDVFERAGFECDQVYEMDASRRSAKSNAYFVGFGRTKRVVLYDTLVESLSTEQVESVLAHELAHWKKHHVWTGMAASTVQTGLLLVVVAALLGADWLYAGFSTPQVSYAGLGLAAVFVGPVATLLAPLNNRLSLAHEREADDFAAEVMGDPEPMASALSELAGDNLSNPFPHPWYAAFHHDHPPIPERISRLREADGPAGDATGGDADPGRPAAVDGGGGGGADHDAADDD